MKQVATRARWSLFLALSITPIVFLVAGASAAGPTGWDHLGNGGSAKTASLNGAVYALLSDGQGVIFLGGTFTKAGGSPASHFAYWRASGSGVWFPFLEHTSLNGDVHAIAYDRNDNRLFVGGNFTNASGDSTADFLAVSDYNNHRWKSFCSPAPAFGGSVSSLQIIGSTLYVGGSFQNGAGIHGANYLLACDLKTGAARTAGNIGDLNGGVYALTKDAGGTLYVGGQFSNVAGIPTADHIVSFDGSWHALGPGVDDYVRSLASSGNDVYIGTDSVNVAGIQQADHVAKWNGSAWSALGANSAGTDAWLPKTAFIYAIAATSSQVVVTGSFQNADGNPLADHIARFDGRAWKPLGSDGAGNGPWIGNGLAVAILGNTIYAGGNFTSAGGDALAAYIARYVPQAAPSNLFTIGAVTPNLSTGTARLTINTPGPGMLTLSGAGVRPAKVTTPSSAGTVKLTVQATGKARRTLDRLGRLKVKLTITFTPTGGTARRRATTVVLKKHRVGTGG